MEILHPIFIIILLILIVGSYIEFNTEKRKKPLMFYVVASVLLIIACGFRGYVGADYGVYRSMYTGFSIHVDYRDVFEKAIFKQNNLDIEWIFVLINKFLFDLQQPFYIVTFVIVTISLLLKSSFFIKYSPIPTLSLLMLYMPLFLIAESGQMRQAVGSSFAIYGLHYAIKRKFFMYLLFFYLAIGFHKTNFIFFPAYWLIRINLNKNKIIVLIVVSILLSPFELYNYAGGILDFMAPQDVSSGFDGYVNDSQFGTQMGFQKTDILYIFMILLLIYYNDTACEKIYYYEYFRNLAVFGFCIFYLVKGNKIFAIRLPGIYIFFGITMVMPAIAYAVKERFRSYSVYFMVIVYSLYMTYSFTSNNGKRANFTIDRYDNYLW